jgi:hypothetical protein
VADDAGTDVTEEALEPAEDDPGMPLTVGVLALPESSEPALGGLPHALLLLDEPSDVGGGGGGFRGRLPEVATGSVAPALEPIPEKLDELTGSGGGW